MGIWTYVASIAVPVIGGMISGLSTREGVKTWYQTIRKPTWNPPKQVFPIVWTSLYAMMGVASGIVWSKVKHFHTITSIMFFSVIPKFKYKYLCLSWHFSQRKKKTSIKPVVDIQTFFSTICLLVRGEKKA
eukprot:TRINITY_DN3902_c0_g1_i1.p1 TRINITY_DN3902_c0_g1~~TRINITY_DN3902_c0_g1_i1.p1  ORF type:complete len:131 (+),score=21.94 TRINITY_DN3902_c0_g1_i1:45-437(+)